MCVSGQRNRSMRDRKSGLVFLGLFDECILRAFF